MWWEKVKKIKLNNNKITRNEILHGQLFLFFTKNSIIIVINIGKNKSFKCFQVLSLTALKMPTI